MTIAAPVWCPTAVRAPLSGLTGCGPMLGGPPRALHHTTEGSTIAGAEATYRKTRAYPHLTIDYGRDLVHQHIPVNVGATAVENASGGVQTNRYGDVCIQIEWVGRAERPFTTKDGLIPAGPNVRGVFDWIRAHGIPDVWPEGAPLAYPGSYGANNGDRHPKVWQTKPGHYAHSQVPENHHGDPGAIDPAFIRQTKLVKASSITTPAPATAVDYPFITLEDLMLLESPDQVHWFVVRLDLSLKSEVEDTPTLDKLRTSGLYKTLGLNARQLAAIPTR